MDINEAMRVAAKHATREVPHLYDALIYCMEKRQIGEPIYVAKAALDLEVPRGTMDGRLAHLHRMGLLPAPEKDGGRKFYNSEDAHLPMDSVLRAVTGNIDRRHDQVFLLKSVGPGMRTAHNFQWPTFGNAEAGGERFTKGGPSPSFNGDGLCAAESFGKASDFHSHDFLIVAVDRRDILGSGNLKVRFKKCQVIDPILWGGNGKVLNALWRSYECVRTSGVRFVGATFSGHYFAVADRTVYADCYFKYAHVGGRINRSEMFSSLFSHASLNVSFSSCLAQFCNFANARIQGAFKFTSFDACNFSGARIEDTLVSNCEFLSCDFKGATLRNVRFEHCKFTGAHFYGANIDEFTARHLRDCGADISLATIQP